MMSEYHHTISQKFGVKVHCVDSASGVDHSIARTSGHVAQIQSCWISAAMEGMPANSVQANPIGISTMVV
jgi:hypothetical protein